MKKKTKKNKRMRVKKQRKMTPDDSFATFVKHFVYGIIGLNAAAMSVAALLGATHFVYGLLIGILASFFYLWSLAEQRKKLLGLLNHPRTDKTPRGFMVRYSIMIVFLILSGMISIVSL